MIKYCENAMKKSRLEIPDSQIDVIVSLICLPQYTAIFFLIIDNLIKTGLKINYYFHRVNFPVKKTSFFQICVLNININFLLAFYFPATLK